MVEHTVDCDSHALLQNEAISTDKGRDLSKVVELEILGGNLLGGLSNDDVQVDVVCLGNCLDGSGPWVTLKENNQNVL